MKRRNGAGSSAKRTSSRNDCPASNVRSKTMTSTRRRFLHLTAGAATLPLVERTAFAQSYPSRPVRIIVPFAAGGGTDITARVIGQWLSERMGQQFVIENPPGGGAHIGT